MFRKSGTMGIYTAHGRLSLSMYKGKEIKSICVDIPRNIVDKGVIISKNLYSTFIKETMKENSFRAKTAYFVIGTDQVLTRNVTMPKMPADQLKINLPYEFRDSITGELKDYLFDYAYRVPTEENANPEEENNSMDLLAVAIEASYYQDISDIMQMAGLKLGKAVPEVSILEMYLRQFPTQEETDKERCFLDIGNSGIRFQVFKNGRFKLAQLIDIGVNHVVSAIADDMNIDMELARTYLRTNFQDCSSSEAAINAYKDISVEVLKGFNYYEMSDMSSRLNEVVLYGGGAEVQPLVDLLVERISMNVQTLEEAFPQFEDENFNIVSNSVGVLLNK